MKLTNKQRIFFIVAGIVAVVSLICFFAMLALVKNNYLFKMDNTLINFSLNMRTGFWTGFFQIITHLGSVYFLIIVAIASIFLVKPIWMKLVVLANFGGGAVINLIIKYWVKRCRPIGVGLIDETGYSFPSAHAMLMLITFGLMVYLLWKIIKNKGLKISIAVIVPILIFIVGFSRVYLGVHFISDVLAGWLIGLVILVCVIMFIEIVEYLIKLKAEEKPKDF